VFEKFVELFV